MPRSTLRRALRAGDWPHGHDHGRRLPGALLMPTSASVPSD